MEKAFIKNNTSKREGEWSMNDYKSVLKPMVSGLYDLQHLRIIMGNRIVINYKSRIGLDLQKKEEENDREKRKILDEIRASYKLMSKGMINKRGFKKEFIGDSLISSSAEFVLVDSFMSLDAQEEKLSKELLGVIKDIPVWKEFMEGIPGLGRQMAAVILSEFDIHKAKYPSSLWKYAGLDVFNGEGRCRKPEHLVDVEYIDKNGEAKTKKGITYNPFLKSKLLAVMGGNFIKAKNRYKEVYDEYKQKLEHSEKHKDKKKHIKHKMALRFMVKRFLVDLYKEWRKLEGLTVWPEYAERNMN